MGRWTYNLRVMTNPVISGIELQPVGNHGSNDLRLIYPSNGSVISAGASTEIALSCPPNLVMVTSSRIKAGLALQASARSSATASLSRVDTDDRIHMSLHRFF